MYEKIVDDNPYKTPMMIYPAVHYTMGGVWVDYNLTTIPGCYCIGEAFRSRSQQVGFQRRQGLTYGYFVLPYTLVIIFLVKSVQEKFPPILRRNLKKLKNMF